MRRANFTGQFGAMQDHLVAAACNVLGEFGAKVEDVHDGAPLEPMPPDVVLAVIGYGTEACRGSLVLVCGRDLLRAVDSHGVSLVTDAELADLLGEMSNLMLGSFKRLLLARGIAMILSTPASFFGRDLTLPPVKGGTSSWHRFATDRGSLYVRLDAIFEASFVLPEVATERRADDAEEGEVVIF